MATKVSQEQKIMRDNIAFLGISDKKRSVALNFCLVGNVLRITEPTFPIWQSTTFGMMTDLKCINQWAKIGNHASVFNKRRIFRMSDINYRFNGLNVLSIKVAPKEDMSMRKPSLLILNSPDKSRDSSKNLTLLDELHQGQELGLEDNNAHC
jgi:hypothetical protein